MGRQSLFEITKGFAGTLEFIRHDYDTMTFISAGDYVVVEGTSHGKMSGNVWTDPDYTGEDIPRFRWGVDRKW